MSDFFSAILASQTVADTEAPANVGAPTVSNRCATTMTLSWTAPTDNVGVTGYKIYRDAVLWVDTGGTTVHHNLTGLTASSIGFWKIVAYDAAGNNSNLATTSGLSVTMGALVYIFDISTSGYISPSAACASGFPSGEKWKDSNGLMSDGDVVYNETCGLSTFDGGSLYYTDGIDRFRISATGVVDAVDAC